MCHILICREILKMKRKQDVEKVNISLDGKVITYYFINSTLFKTNNQTQPNPTTEANTNPAKSICCFKVIRIFLQKRVQVRYISQMLRRALFSILQAVLRVINRVWLLYKGNWQSPMSYFIHYACLMRYHTLLPRIGAPSSLHRDQTVLLLVEWVCGRLSPELHFSYL